MLGLGWFALRQAQEALKAGHLDEVQRLLSQPGMDNRRGRELRGQLARAYAERGERHLRRDDAAAAWGELLRAEHADATEPTAAHLRQALMRLGLAEVRALLEVGKPSRALEVASHLRERGVRQPELDSLTEAARHWVRAMELADRGEFAQSRLAGEQAQRGLPGAAASWQQFHQSLNEREQSFAQVAQTLLEAAQAAQWREVIALCERVLSLAPEHAEARKLRAQAWRAIEPETVVSGPVQREAAADSAR